MLLIRHASIDGLGHRLVGRAQDIHLNAKGLQEAQLLASRLARLPLVAIYSSPRERALETAAAIADPLKVPVAPCADLDEVDYGDWTNCPFSELAQREDWRSFNARRHTAQIPGGESMQAFTARVARAIFHLHTTHPDLPFAVVTHADWVRAAGACCTNLTLDDWKPFEVDPASISAIRLDPSGAAVLRWNDTGCWQPN